MESTASTTVGAQFPYGGENQSANRQRSTQICVPDWKKPESESELKVLPWSISAGSSAAATCTAANSRPVRARPLSPAGAGSWFGESSRFTQRQPAPHWQPTFRSGWTALLQCVDCGVSSSPQQLRFGVVTSQLHAASGAGEAAAVGRISCVPEVHAQLETQPACSGTAMAVRQTSSFDTSFPGKYIITTVTFVTWRQVAAIRC